MRALDTCDFCGADATGTFEVLPPELEPAEDEQRRVLLCEGCATRLETLLEPLLARAGATADGSDTSENGSDDGWARTDGAESLGSTGTDRRGASVGDGDATSAGPTAIDEEPSDGVPGSDDASTPSADTTADSPPPATDPVDGITLGRDERDPRTDSSTDGDQPTSDPGSADDQPTSERPPQSYGRVLRLLGNRELPIERAAAEALAAGAYDLETHEIEAVFEYALANGELVEVEGELDRP